MNIQFKSNYGNFDYVMSVELGLTPPLPDGVESLIQQGLANIAYRVAGSAVDKALGVETGKGKEGRRGVKWDAVIVSGKGDEEIRTPASKVIETTVNDKLALLIDVPKGITFKVTGQHEYGAEGESAMVRATAFVETLMAKQETEAQLRGTLGMLGMADAETATKEELVAFAHSKGLGISTKKK